MRIFFETELAEELCERGLVDGFNLAPWRDRIDQCWTFREWVFKDVLKA